MPLLLSILYSKVPKNYSIVRLVHFKDYRRPVSKQLIAMYI